MFKNKKIYLDHASTTPIDPQVIKEMQPYFTKHFHNASAIHGGGVFAKKALEKSRAKVASLLGARPQEIIFTQGATEANNLAILGLVKKWTPPFSREKRGGEEVKLPHIITSNIEHPSVLETCKYLGQEKLAEVSYLEVGEDGIVKASDLKKLLQENTILVSVMYANNEIGTIQPIRELAKTIRWWRKNQDHVERGGASLPYFHTDAVQAVNYLNIDVLKLGVDMMTINASKIYGPKMIGCLYKKTDFSISPLTYGGGQEFGLRPGTENISACIGMAKSLEITSQLREQESERLKKLQDYFIEGLLKLPGIKLNGSREVRLPNNIHVSVSGFSGEELVLRLDAKGIQASTQSACHADNPSIRGASSQQSYVVKALGQLANDDATLRFTMGRETRKGDIDYTLGVLKGILVKYR